MNNFSIISCCEAVRDAYAHPKTYEDKAIRLAKSIRKLDKLVDIFMWYGEDKKPSQETIETLESLGCKMVQGICVFPENPVYNKVEALTTVPVNTEYRVFLDTDMYVRSNLEAFNKLDCDIAFTPDMYEHHTMARLDDWSKWIEYFDYFRIPPIQRQYLTTTIDKKQINLFGNVGMMVLKNKDSILDEYKSLSRQVMESSLPYSKAIHDPIAASLLIYKQGLRYEALPESLNYFYSIHKDIEGDIIHYQGNDLSSYKELTEW